MNIDEMIEEFFYLKQEQKQRRVAYIGPDRVFYAQPTELAVKLKMEELTEQIGLAAKK